jgi:ABC-2 type transport system permease protein
MLDAVHLDAAAAHARQALAGDRGFVAFARGSCTAHPRHGERGTADDPGVSLGDDVHSAVALEQTITYLLVRPVPKWALYTVKLLATITTAIVFTVVLTVLTYLAIFVGSGAPAHEIPLRCLKVAAIHSLAVVAYCSLFGLLSLLTKRILIVGVVYTVLVEGLLANLPFGIRLITVIYYTRLIAYRSMEFLVPLPDGRTENMAAEAWQLDPKLLEHPPSSTCLAVLLIGSLVCTALAAWLCTSREFHVKTPEKE